METVARFIIKRSIDPVARHARVRLRLNANGLFAYGRVGPTAAARGPENYASLPGYRKESRAYRNRARVPRGAEAARKIGERDAEPRVIPRTARSAWN